MASDHELARLIEIESLEHGEGRYQRGVIDQAAAQGRESQGRRAAHAAKGTYEPDTDSTVTHEGRFLERQRAWWSEQAGCRGRPNIDGSAGRLSAEQIRA